MKLSNIHAQILAELAQLCRSGLIVGPCGTGKSHLAQALGHCAVRQGQDVVFASCAQLLASLNAARAIGNYERKLQQLARVPVLIIDLCSASSNVE